MEFSSFFTSLNLFRASANLFLSQYEPLSLLLAPLLSLFAAWALQYSLHLVRDKGLKATILGFFINSIKLVPGVRNYIDAEKQKVVDKLQSSSSSKSKRDGWRTELPRVGLGVGALEKMNEEKRNDVAWQGKCSGTVYIAGGESEGHFSLINQACSMFSHTNPLHLDVFQSVVRFEAEVVAMAAALLGGKEKASGGQICGNMTSGGTESILLAVKSSRDFMKAKKGITRPEMIIPESAHSAYDKAAQYFNIKLWRIPVNKEFIADITAIKRRINKNTVLIVGSAPGFPHGIIDPIVELGELAFTCGICFHVDLCLGGFVLPFARELGYPIPPFDFSVTGVTSISVDVHKYGLAPKGTSVVLYRDHKIRKHQFVAVTEWSGGLYVSPTIAGSRPGALIAGAWAAMMSLGFEGYLSNTREIMEVSKRIQKGIKEIPELFVIGRPDMTIVAFGSNILDIFEVNDIMSSKGWHLNALQRPNSIHICVTLQHVPVVEDFLKDLRASVQTVKERPGPSEPNQETGYNWKICNVTAGPDYIPCLDNLQAIRNLPTTKHYEHRERHCPEDPPTCLVLLPEGYQRPIKWPTSRKKVWYHNVPHTKLVEMKGHQNWVKINGDYLTFPGGGTQFKHGALHYIDFIQESMPAIAWGKRTRVILDVGCGVASFGGFLFERDVLTMSFAPKDEHEAQVQFALERGIPAISAVMGTKRLPFPGRVFDVVHCARCRVPWHIEGGKLLLELNRLLRPGGFFVWSATPVYPRLPEDPEIWEAMNKLTKSMCWELVQRTKDSLNRAGIAIFQKPTSNECYENRSKNEPPLCQQSDDLNAAWNVPLQTCMHEVPVNASERGSQWPEQWPARVDKPPYWLLSSQVGVYGKAAPEDFTADYEHWKHVVTNSYLKRMGINWSNVRNAMDMKAVYGGFAAALRDLKVWVMNVVLIDSPDTLPIIYERGLFGIYHDWCESFSTYPRSYDLLHADHLFSKIKKKCNLVAVVAEVDRILRPEGKLIVRDEIDTISELQSLLKSMHWVVRFTYSKDKKGLLVVQKTMWRPTEVETITYAIA